MKCNVVARSTKSYQSTTENFSTNIYIMNGKAPNATTALFRAQKELPVMAQPTKPSL